MPKSQVTVRLDKAQLARARRALGARTVTEAIETSLALATEKAAHDAILQKYSGVGRKHSLKEALARTS